MPRPLLVLISGHPGSGKTTLGRVLSDAMHLPHINRDRIRAGWQHTHDRAIDDPRHAWEVFAQAIELYAANGISLVVDQTLYTGMEPEITERFVPIASVVNVHCRCPHAYERWVEKVRVHEGWEEVNERVLRETHKFTDPLALGVPLLEVETSDGYDPPLDELIRRIGELRSE
jgi:predicted ABC-type ATPase